jgi:PKD repeat protein
VDYAFSFGDNTFESGSDAVRSHSYSSAGTYTVTVTVTDDDGNTSTAQVTVEVTEMPPPVETNYKPLVAVIFAIILAVAGVWSSKRRPWKGGKERSVVLKSFVLTALPFVLVEAATGILSISFEPLRIPPLIGWGTGVDCAILAAGFFILIVRVAWKRESKSETSSD